MTDPITSADFAQFLESLKVTKEHTTEAHILAVRGILYRYRGQIEDSDIDEILRVMDSLEANAKPPTLLEDVKACMRKSLGVGYDYGMGYTDSEIEMTELKKLTEAE